MNPPARLLAVACLCVAATAHAQPKDADKSKLLHADDLVIGPIKATLTYPKDENLKPKEVTLLMLTRTKVVFYDFDKSGQVIKKREVKEGRLFPTVTVSKEFEWNWDKDKKQYAGKPMPLPPEADFALKPNPVAPEQHDHFLLDLAELLHTDLDNAIDARDGAAIKSYLAYAAKVERHARDRKVRDIADLFDLSRYADAQQGRMKKFHDALAEAAKVKATAEQKLAASKTRLQEEAAAANFLEAVGAAMVVTGDTPEERERGKRLRSEAASSFNKAAINHLENTARIKEESERVGGKLKSDMVDAYAAVLVAADARRGAIAAARTARKVSAYSHRELDELIVRLARAKDFTQLINALTEQDKRLRADRRVDVFLLCRLNTLQANVRKLKTRSTGTANDLEKTRLQRAADAEFIFELARQTAAAANDIPPDPLFDASRVYVLGVAAELVFTAVTHSYGAVYWSACHDPRADYGVRLIDVALAGLIGADSSGQMRTHRAVLLFLRGLPVEARKQAQEVETVREKDGTSQYHLARIHSHLGYRPEADACLQRAFRGGYSDVAAVAADPDLFAARNYMVGPKTPGFWLEHYQKPKLEVVFESVPTAGGLWSYNVIVRNKSPFPLTGATVNLAVPFPGAVNGFMATTDWKYWPVRVDHLPPNSSLIAPDIAKSNFAGPLVREDSKYGVFLGTNTKGKPLSEGTALFQPR